jgi:alkylhydroperoxidase family enzyme
MTKTINPQSDDAFRKKVLTCTQVLNGMLFELQARHGRDAVVAAVMEIAGCSVCVADKTTRGRAEGLRALLDRPAAHRATSAKRS